MITLLSHFYPKACCLEAESIDKALTILENSCPSIILLDLNLPNTNGIEGLKLIREFRSEIPVIILSASENPFDMQRSIDAGAKGYLKKTELADVILSTINTVLNGETHIPHILQTQSNDIFNKLKVAEKITPRQLDVLKLMHIGKRNKEIADILGVSEATIKVHCRDIFHTLGVNNRHKAVQKAISLSIINT